MLEAVYTAIADFFVYNGYTLEMTAAVTIFAAFFKRRRLFPLRAAASYLVLLAAYLLWNVFGDTTIVWHEWLKYLTALFVCFFAVWFCWEVSPWSAFFCTVGGTTTQHCAFRIGSLILAWTGNGYATVFAAVTNLICIFLVYGIVFAVFSKQMKAASEKLFQNKMNLLLGSIVILFDIFIHISETPFRLMTENIALYTITSAYGITCSITALFLQYGIFRNSKLDDDNEVLEWVVAKQKEQYRRSKENIDMINIKCHDMKHQISMMESRIDSNALKEINSIIKVYDSSIKTGNEVLDVFLTEKNAICEQNGIRFDCIADGGCLSFLESSEIYALFGNAFDNAIEAVLSVKNEEKRIIGLSVKRQLNMVVIHFENYFEGGIDLVGGFPQTTKKDRNYHGFGLRSIRMIAEKYGGSVSVLAEDNVFNLNILIAIPKRSV